MKILYGLFILIFATTATAFSQPDTTIKERHLPLFDKINNGAKEYKLDTSSGPNDKVTRKIIELRNLRGGFNINEIVDYKLEEDKQKGEIPASELARFSAFIKNGNGKKWLDNAVVWIYRQHFTYKELKQLVKFYKTAAGQKMAGELPIVMMQSLIAADIIQKHLFKPKSKKVGKKSMPLAAIMLIPLIMNL